MHICCQASYISTEHKSISIRWRNKRERNLSEKHTSKYTEGIATFFPSNFCCSEGNICARQGDLFKRNLMHKEVLFDSPIHCSWNPLGKVQNLKIKFRLRNWWQTVYMHVHHQIYCQQSEKINLCVLSNLFSRWPGTIIAQKYKKNN